ncbi:hypothetical protein [Halomonas sp. WWR20]
MLILQPRWLILALTFIVLPAHAIDLANIEAAKERAGIIDRVRELLNDESPSIRLAVFDEVMKGDDPVLRSMAQEAALNADDERLQTAALRQLFRDRESILVEIIQPSQATQPQAYLYSVWHGLSLYNLKIDETSDEFTGTFNAARTGTPRTFNGQLVRGGWQANLVTHLSAYTCVLAIREITGVDLTGSLECEITGKAAGEDQANGRSASLPVRVKLS